MSPSNQLSTGAEAPKVGEVQEDWKGKEKVSADPEVSPEITKIPSKIFVLFAQRLLGASSDQWGWAEVLWQGHVPGLSILTLLSRGLSP